jgi:serine/alanine adding enzyme
MPNSSQTDLLAQLKIQKSNKGEIARQFKSVIKGSTEHQALLDQMKIISTQIDETEAAIKAIGNQITEHAPEISEKIAFDFLEPKKNWDQEIKIEVAENHHLDLWYTYLQQHQHTPYHMSTWLKLIGNQFGHSSIILLALNEQGDILGGLPLTLFSSKLFGRFAVSIPYINYGGPISDYRNINQALIGHSKQLLEKFNLSHIEIRSIQADLYPLCTSKKASMILRLPQSNDILEKDLGAKLRSQYKKAEEYSPQLKIGKTELLDDFYYVFARNMRDLGTPVYPKSFFQAILDEPNIQSTLLTVELNNKPVSAAFLIANGDVLEIPWASTITDANKKNMNMWMYRNILSFAIEQKFTFFDFGRSTIDAGTYKFKKQWGAEPRQHYWYYVMPEGRALPEINPNNPKYKIFIALWKLMPVWTSKLLGPLLIKNIP